MPATGATAYELGAGEATLDLRQLDSATDRHRPPSGSPSRWVPATSPSSCPNGLDTRVDASVGFGDITHTRWHRRHHDTTGSDRSTSTVIGDQPVQVVVDAQLGLGQITIQEQ